MIQANHIASLANAKAIKSFREYVKDGKIGPSFALSPNYAYSCKPKDVLAMENAEEFNVHWWLDVYCRGEYPKVVFRYMERMGIEPIIEEGDMELLKEGIPDFMGVNYYQTTTVEMNSLEGGVDDSGTFNTTGKKGTSKETGIPGVFKTIKNPNLEATNWDWEIDPEGLRIGMRRITSRYNLPILITENGLGEYDKLENGEIHDEYRIKYLKKHIEACKEAVNDGVDLIGYCTWSFTDLLSWLNGYQKRYGFVYIDRDEDDEKEMKRYKKDSFYWYKKVIETNGEEL